jgi:hypothetical protein
MGISTGRRIDTKRRVLMLGVRHKELGIKDHEPTTH